MSASERRDPVLETAMDWLLRVHDAPSDPLLRAQLEAWIAADPLHAQAWDRARRSWQKLGDVGAPVPSRRLAVHRIGIATAAAALAACLVLLLFPSLLLRLQADHVTAAAELRRVALEDGSAVQLAPSSAIAVRYTATGRRVSLVAGEAFFEVTANPDRPFLVAAGGIETKVIGTAFDVRVAPDAVTVAVAAGSVGVRDGRQLDTQLGAGDRVVVDRASGRLIRDRMKPDDVAAWRDGRLFVADATIAQVVDEIRRFHPGWIVIADDRLAQQRITGLYDLRHPGDALRAVVQPAGGKVRTVTPLLHILSAR
jgi:transmembrane sensor